MVRDDQVGLTERSVVINKLQTFFSMFSFIYSLLDRKKIFNEIIRKCDSENFESYEYYYNYALREIKTKIINDVNAKYEANCFIFFNAVASVFSSHFVMKDLDMLSKFKIVSEAFRVLKEPIDEDTWTMIIVRYPLFRNAIEMLIENSVKKDDLEEFSNKFPPLKGLFAQYFALSSKSLDFTFEKVDSRIKILGGKAVQRLYNKMYEGSFEARDILIESCLPYIRNVINNSKGVYLSYDDLFQIGCLGVIETFNRYNPSINDSLYSYAIPGIYKNVVRSIKTGRNGVKFPSNQFCEIYDISCKIESLSKELGRFPTCGEMVEELGISKEQLQKISLFLLPFENLDSLTYDEELDDTIESYDEVESNKEIIDTVFSILTPSEREFISRRYGFDRDKGLSFIKMALDLGVSHETVRQADLKILRKNQI